MPITHKIAPWIIISFFAISHATEPVFSVILPNMVSALNTTNNLIQLSSATYIIGFSFGILTLGRVSDLVGRKPTIIFGLLTYAIASIGCATAGGMKFMLCCRFMQAFGVSVGSCVAQAIIRDVYKGHSLSYIYNLIALSMSLIPSMAAGISGLITDKCPWEYNIYLLSVAAVVITFLTQFKLSETHKNIEAVKDIPYFELISRLIRDKKVIGYALVTGGCNSILLGFYIEAPFIFMESMRLSTSDYGMLILLISIFLFCSGLVNRHFIKQGVSQNTTIRIAITCIVLGLFLSFITSVFFDSLAIKYNLVLLVLGRITYLFGHGIVIPYVMRFALEDYREVNGTAGSIFGSMYYLIVAIGNLIISLMNSSNIIGFTGFQLIMGLMSASALIFLRKSYFANSNTVFRAKI